MDQVAVEEENISGLHKGGNSLKVIGDGHRFGGEALRFIGGDMAEDRKGVRSWDDAHAAVFLVTVVDGQPRCDARSGIGAEIGLILVKRLAACGRRLEVEHRLGRIRFFAKNFDKDRTQSLVENKIEAERIAPMGMDDPRILGKGVAPGSVDLVEILFSVGGIPLHKVTSDLVYFFRREDV